MKLRISRMRIFSFDKFEVQDDIDDKRFNRILIYNK